MNIFGGEVVGSEIGIECLFVFVFVFIFVFVVVVVVVVGYTPTQRPLEVRLFLL